MATKVDEQAVSMVKQGPFLPGRRGKEDETRNLETGNNPCIKSWIV